MTRILRAPIVRLERLLKGSPAPDEPAPADGWADAGERRAYEEQVARTRARVLAELGAL